MVLTRSKTKTKDKFSSPKAESASALKVATSTRKTKKLATSPSESERVISKIREMFPSKKMEIVEKKPSESKRQRVRRSLFPAVNDKDQAQAERADHLETEQATVGHDMNKDKRRLKTNKMESAQATIINRKINGEVMKEHETLTEASRNLSDPEESKDIETPADIEEEEQVSSSVSQHVADDEASSSESFRAELSMLFKVFERAKNKRILLTNEDIDELDNARVCAVLKCLDRFIGIDIFGSDMFSSREKRMLLGQHRYSSGRIRSLIEYLCDVKLDITTAYIELVPLNCNDQVQHTQITFNPHKYSKCVGFAFDERYRDKLLQEFEKTHKIEQGLLRPKLKDMTSLLKRIFKSPPTPQKDGNDTPATIAPLSPQLSPSISGSTLDLSGFENNTQGINRFKTPERQTMNYNIGKIETLSASHRRIKSHLTQTAARGKLLSGSTNVYNKSFWETMTTASDSTDMTRQTQIPQTKAVGAHERNLQRAKSISQTLDTAKEDPQILEESVLIRLMYDLTIYLRTQEKVLVNSKLLTSHFKKYKGVEVSESIRRMCELFPNFFTQVTTTQGNSVLHIHTDIDYTDVLQNLRNRLEL